MDGLDLKILRTVGLRPFSDWPVRPAGLKASVVARALGCNVELVKSRLARMEHSGLIRGYRVFPNPELFGLNLASYHLVADPQAPLAPEQVEAVDGVVGAYGYVGGDLCIDLAYASKTERDRRLRLIEQILSAREGALGYYERHFPLVDRDLSPLDWRIISALRSDAKRPLALIARELGVTAKTVRARTQRLLEDGAIDPYVDIDLFALPGVVMVGFAFYFPPESWKATTGNLLKMFDDHYIAAWRPPQNGLGMFDMDLAARSMAELRELEAQARQAPDVERVVSLIPKEGFYNEAWIDERIDAMADAPKSVVSGG